MINKFTQDHQSAQAKYNHTKFNGTTSLIPGTFHLGSSLLIASAIVLSPILPAQSEQLEAKDLEVESLTTEIETSQRKREKVKTAPQFAEKGYKSWYIQGAAATTLDGLEEDTRVFGLAGVGLSEFLFNRHSINLEFNTLYFAQPGENAVGFNLNGMFRWHFAKRENWSIFFDSGAGILVTTNDVPRGAAAFNFTPQLGGGASFKLKNDRQLLVGLRWHHISHAETFGNNPGRDSLQGFVRLDFPR